MVTGAAGFVGSTLSKALISEGHDVVGIDALTDYYDRQLKLENLQGLLGAQRFEFVEEDLRTVDLDQMLADVEVIYHQAGQPGVRASWGSEFLAYTEANIDATQRLLEAAVKQGSIRRFVYASSSSVYGNAESYPTLETDLPQPLSPYGVTKLAAEHLCSLYAANFGLPTVSLRYFTVYGPGQRPDMAFTRFVQAAVADEQIVIYGDGTQIRDFTFVDDVVHANMLAAQREVPPGTVLNVAGGSNISVNEVLRMIEEISGKKLKISYENKVQGDVFRTGGSTERIEEILGWRPSVSLESGLKRHYQWALERASSQNA